MKGEFSVSGFAIRLICLSAADRRALSETLSGKGCGSAVSFYRILLLRKMSGLCCIRLIRTSGIVSGSVNLSG